MRRSMPPRLKSRIKQIRKERGLTQQQVAIALSAETHLISYYENNQVFPGPENIVALCDALDCQIGELYVVTPPEK